MLKDTDELAQQIGISLDTYHSEHLGPEIRNILIVSTSGEGKALKKQVENKLKLAVEIIEPLGNVSCSHGVDRTDLQERYPFSITAVVGILLSDTNNLIHLAPEEMGMEKMKRMGRRRLLQYALFCLIAAFMSVAGHLMNIQKRKTHLELLKNDIERLQPRLEKSRKKIQFVEYFDQKLAQYKFIPDLVDEFNRLTPEGVSFRALSLDKKGEITVQGYAWTNAGINELQACLIRSPLFHDVDLKFATSRKIADKSVMDFKIALQLDDNKREAP